MTPDDPRHGTNAGFFAHQRANQTPCEPCYTAKNRALKLWRLRGGNMTTLGHDAHRIVARSLPASIRHETGIAARILRGYVLTGPDARCRPETRARILASNPVSAIGICRRLQALACLGWSTADISARTGFHRTNVSEIRLSPSQYNPLVTVQRVTKVYDELHMTPAPNTQGSRNTRRIAEQNGWVPPFAWDVIDDPDETPKGVGFSSLNHWGDYADDYAELRRDGYPLDVIADRLNMNTDALMRALERHRDDPRAQKPRRAA
jgi:hypothetical protein